MYKSALVIDSGPMKVNLAGLNGCDLVAAVYYSKGVCGPLKAHINKVKKNTFK